MSPRATAMEYMVEQVDPPFLQKRFINSYKGWGIFATHTIFKGNFILEYRGKLRTEMEMDQEENDRIYVYFFQFNGNKCLDATQDDGSFGRLVNDSSKLANSVMKIMVTYQFPHLCLFASRDINPGEEILYDYGVEDLPWRQEKFDDEKSNTMEDIPINLTHKSSIGEYDFAVDYRCSADGITIEDDDDTHRDLQRPFASENQLLGKDQSKVDANDLIPNRADLDYQNEIAAAIDAKDVERAFESKVDANDPVPNKADLDYQNEIAAAIDAKDVERAFEVIKKWRDGLNDSSNNDRLKENSMKKKRKVQRRKFQCPVMGCSRRVINLKKHLMTRISDHNWDAEKAASAVSDFGLRKKRKDKTEGGRKTERRFCCLCHNLKSFVRIHNHLRSYHELKGNISDVLKKCIITITEDAETEASTDCTSSEYEEVEEVRKLDFCFACETGKESSNFMDSHSSDTSDEDWLCKEYMQSQFGEEISREDSSNQECITETKGSSREEIPSPSSTHINKETVSNGTTMTEVEFPLDMRSDEDSDREYEDMDDGFLLTSTDEDKLVNKFIRFLCSVDGGGKSVRTAAKHARTIQLLLRYKDENNRDFTLLWNRKFLNNWMTFATSADEKGVKKMEAGTVRTYLGSVQHFHRYLDISDEDFDLSKIKGIEAVIKGWKRQLWKDMERRRHAKNLIDLENFPKSEEITKFDNSNEIKEIKMSLRDYAKTEKSIITKNGFTKIRDYLTTMLVFDNAARPGSLVNMTLGEFKTASRQTDGMVVAVARHKTDYKGPAYVSFAFSLYQETQQFIKFVRNKLVGIGFNDDDCVFVSYSGCPMMSNMLTTQMNRLWQKVIGSNSHINPTLVRKYTTTEVHANHQDFKKDAANHLCHDVKTADSCYNIIDKKQKAANISAKIKTIQRRDPIPKMEVVDYFITAIKTGSITTTAVNDIVDTEDQLAHYRNAKGKKKVLDIIRYEIKKKNKGNKSPASDSGSKSPDDEEEQESPRSPISDSKSESSDEMEVQRSLYSSRVRKEFSSEENSLIRKYLSSYITNKSKPIIYREFEKFVQEKSPLNKLVEKFGVQSLIVKVRTERKK